MALSQSLQVRSSAETIVFNLEKFQDDKAILKNSQGFELIWPIAKLPKDYQIGDQISVNISNDKSTDNNQEKYTAMRKLLEELIN